MKTRNIHDQLDDYVLDQLTPAERKEFEAHLSSCLACSGELKKLDNLKSKIAKLPAGIPLERDLWPGIEKGIGGSASGPAIRQKASVESLASSEENASQQSEHRSGVPIFSLFARPYIRAAAVLVVLLGAAAVWILMKDQSRPPVELRSHNMESPERNADVAVRPDQADSTLNNKPALSEQTATGDRTNKSQNLAKVEVSTSLLQASDQAKSAISKVDAGDDMLGRLQTSFVNYTTHLPNDRVYLQFDKPFYRPGESIWFRAYVRDDADLGPSRQSDFLHVELINPKGTVAKELTLYAKNGVASGDFDLEEHVPGGIYKIKAYTQWQKNLGDPFFFERDLQVQHVILPSIRLKMEFERKAFGPGDNVVAKVEASTLQNKPIVNTGFTTSIMLDGKQFKVQNDKTDRTGTSYVAFDLPKDLKSTDGLLGIIMSYDGLTGSISRSIPIVLNNIQLTLFPEGGDLIAGLPSNVAFQAMNEFNKPADIEGVVVDDLGRTVTRFVSYHQGMGAFAITPEAGRTYHAKITKPEGVDEIVTVPQALEYGYTLAVQHRASGAIEFLVGSLRTAEMGIVCQSRGKILFTKRFTVRKGIVLVPFPMNDLGAGVVQATLFDELGVEQAERLVFVNKDKMMKLEVSTDKSRYLPREKVTMNIKATDLHGNILMGDLSLAVADDKLISFADDKTGNILARMLLEPDLKGKVEEPNFYFDPKEPKADSSLDYLMMTRGWRRFAWKEVMADQLPNIKFQPELAVVGGFVRYDTSGKPVQGARVVVSGSDSIVAVTDSAGHYRFRYVDLSSPLRIEITRNGYGQFERVISGFSDSVNCTLWKNGSTTKVVGRIFDRTRKSPVRGAVVSIVGIGQSVETDDQGIYTMQAIPAGTHTVQVTVPGYVNAHKQVVNVGAPLAVIDIGMDFPSPVQIQMQGHAELQKPVKEKEDVPGVSRATGRITGRVLDAGTGESLVGATVIVEGTIHGAATDHEGKFTVLNVPVGRYNVRASEVGYSVITTSNIDVRPNSTTNIVYSLASSAVMMQAVTVQAEMPILQKDYTNTVVVANEMNVAAAPNKGAGQKDEILKLQAGGARQDNLFLRGGRGDEVQYLVEGIPQKAKPIEGVANFDDEPAAENQLVARGGGGLIAQSKPASRFYRAREFPAQVYADETRPLVRTDFRSTIYWKGDVSLDKSGKATVTFFNSDEISAFRATVEGISTTGLVGRAEKTFYTQLPFSLSAKAPEEVSMGDKVLIPLTLKNNTSRTVKGKLSITAPDSWMAMEDAGDARSIAAGASTTVYVPFEILDKPGAGKIHIAFESEGLSDAFDQDVYVGAKGFPQRISFASGDQEKTYSFAMNHVIKGTVQANLNAYPNVTSSLLTAVDAMLQEPGGCFEQASSINYPNALALRYLQETGSDDVNVRARATKLLDKGYEMLSAYETKDKGYEWFGSTPPNEALTAYGVLEFSDMQPVYASLDKVMVKRTTDWLISRRDGKGGFLRDPKAVDSFGHASPEITNAYIVYALAGAGNSDIKSELDAVYAKAVETGDPYQLALVANAMISVRDKARASKLVSALLKAQRKDGSWTGSSHSITQSTGKSLELETTSLSLLALFGSGNPDPSALDKGVKFLLANRSGYGSFGSTQSTILSLKALTEYAKYAKRTAEPGDIDIMLDGSRIARKSYVADEPGPIVVDNLEKNIAADDKKHLLTVAMKGTKHPLPYSMQISWNTTQPNNDDSVKVLISTSLAQREVRMGGTVRLSAVLKNRTNEGMPMTMAVVGIPGGLSAQPWQLKELQEKGVFDFYEIKGRYVAFYYRQMKPAEERTLNLDLKAEIPGTYEAPASSAYLYYTNEFKSWSGAGTIEVRP